MEKEIEKFLEEYTDKFSELFVQTFLIRYHDSFANKHLEESKKILKKLLIQKIEKGFNSQKNTYK